MMKYLFLVLAFAYCSNAFSQDSTFVNELCSMFQGNRKASLEVQLEAIGVKIGNHLTQSTFSNSTNKIQDINRFHYKLYRQLSKTCLEFPIKEFPIKYQKVIDLENLFVKKEIDSLKTMTLKIRDEKQINLFIISIDEYYPNKNIVEFGQKKREAWGMNSLNKNGDILLVFSTNNKEINISTSTISMKYLNDKECTEVIEIMIPEFKNQNFFNGVLQGIIAINMRLD